MISAEYCYAVPAGQAALLAEFSEGLNVLRASGEYQQIHEKWLGVHQEEAMLFPVILRYVAWVAVPLALLVLLSFLWSWTLRKRVAEQTGKLRESEAYIRQILNNLPVGLAVNTASPAVRFTFMNDLFPKLYRTTKEALQESEKFWETVYEDPEVRERMRKQVLEDCASGDPVRMCWEGIPISRQGEETSYISAQNIPLPGGGQMVSMVWDVTDQVLKAEALRNNERLFRIAGQSAKIGGWSMDLKTEKCVFSDQVLTILEMPPGTTFSLDDLLQFFAPESRGKMEAFHDACAGKGVPSDETVEVVTATGQCRWVRIIGEPVYDGSGSIVQIQGAIQDITDDVSIRTQLQQSQKLESIGRLAGGVAHDFNNMLSVILGYTELAMRRVEAEDALHNDLTQIRTAAFRSADVVRQLLAFARKQTISPVLLDLNEAIEQTLKMLRHLIGENVELVWKSGILPCKVRIDPAQLDQILVNLCVNANDAIKGVGKIIIETGHAKMDSANRLHLDTIPPGEYVTLAISDTGVGMDKTVLEQIFEPFFTTKELGKGTGLGLSTIYGIVRQNKGYINVYSEPGKGTTFRIYLPCVASPVEPEATPDDSELQTGKGETILLVEDEASILKMGRMMLEALGYQVLTAEGPHEALAVAAKHDGTIDLLVTDVIMPEMNGREMAETLIAERPDLRCLYMSGFSANKIADQGILDPDTHFIQKPFTIEQLASRIREALRSIP